MKTNPFFKLHILFIFFFLSNAKAALSPAEEKRVVENHLSPLIEDGLAMGLIVAVVKEQEARFYPFGKKRRGGNPPGPDTLFDIGSVTKSLTGLVLAIADREGLLTLDRPIDPYLPSSLVLRPVVKNKVMPWHLATHTAGLPREFPEGPRGASLEDLVDVLRRWSPPAPPGEDFLYSNFGFQLLAFILGQAGHKPYGDILREKLVRPLGMSFTTLLRDLPENADMAQGHNGQGREVVRSSDPFFWGPGGVVSTARDLSLFLRAHWNEEGQSFQLREALRLTRTAHWRDQGLGVGIKPILINGERVTLVQKNGAVTGFTAYIAFVPEKRTGVVVLCNTRYGVTELGRDLLVNLLNKGL